MDITSVLIGIAIGVSLVVAFNRWYGPVVSTRNMEAHSLKPGKYECLGTISVKLRWMLNPAKYSLLLCPDGRMRIYRFKRAIPKCFVIDRGGLSELKNA
jgi:hypothetical protein